jgi:hypothetical protein
MAAYGPSARGFPSTLMNMASTQNLSASEKLKSRIKDRAPLLACFNVEDYQTFNPDLASVEPLNHFAAFGIWEGRKCVAPERLTATLARMATRHVPKGLTAEDMRRGYRGALWTTPSIHLPTDASAAERAFAEHLAAALDAVNLGVKLREGPPDHGDKDAVVINPARLFNGRRDDADVMLYSTCVMAVLDAPSTPEFSKQLPYVLAGAGLVAAEPETYTLFHEARIPSLWTGVTRVDAPVGEAPANHPLVGGLRRTIRHSPATLPWIERPIDVLAIEPVSPARSNSWARMAEGMSRFSTTVYQPISGAVADEDEVALRRYLYARSKIVLHLHEDEPTALPTFLFGEVTAGGGLILSEPCRPHLTLKPERHYFESSARRMPGVVQALRDSSAGSARATAAVAAARSAAAAFDLEEIGLALVNLIVEEPAVARG